jgi:3-methyladenine DNA glycosylase AlkD
MRPAEADRQLIGELIAALEQAADPERATGQQAYMKSAIPFYGVQMPEVRRLCRAVCRAHPIASRDVWMATVEALWWQAEHREERYAALELLSARQYQLHRQDSQAELLNLLEQLIVSGAWWDYVDPIAINQVGPLLKADADFIRPRLLDWSTGTDIWLRRAAILAQLKFKAQTDWPLLQQFLEPSLASREFFLRKSIGWALREYSKTEPVLVLDYVRRNGKVLSGLSKREGLKVLRKQGVVSRDDPVFAGA